MQSARDTQLRTLGRPHNAKQARAAFAAARRAGFENISGDIMLALPHYTQAEFDETLELIAEGGATHISAYLLKIEPDSAFGRHPPEGLPSPDEAADFYLYAVEHLEHHGYRQYEISNFAKPGYEGRHNLIYWDCGDYLGLGPAAHSCMGSRRFYYPADTEAFLNDKAAPVMDGGCGAEDYLILQLRLRKGLDLAAYKARYGKEFFHHPARLCEKLCKVRLCHLRWQHPCPHPPPVSLCRTAFWRSCCKRLSGRSLSKCPLGWDPVAAGNRAGDGMACNGNDCRLRRKQGVAVGAAASRMRVPLKAQSDPLGAATRTRVRGESSRHPLPPTLSPHL